MQSQLTQRYRRATCCDRECSARKRVEGAVFEKVHKDIFALRADLRGGDARGPSKSLEWFAEVE